MLWENDINLFWATDLFTSPYMSIIEVETEYICCRCIDRYKIMKTKIQAEDVAFAQKCNSFLKLLRRQHRAGFNVIVFQECVYHSHQLLYGALQIDSVVSMSLHWRICKLLTKYCRAVFSSQPVSYARNRCTSMQASLGTSATTMLTCSRLI